MEQGAFILQTRDSSPRGRGSEVPVGVAAGSATPASSSWRHRQLRSGHTSPPPTAWTPQPWGRSLRVPELTRASGVRIRAGRVMETLLTRGSEDPARRLHRSGPALAKAPAPTSQRREPRATRRPERASPRAGRCPEQGERVLGVGPPPRPLAVLAAAVGDAAPLSPGRPALRSRLRGGPGSRPGRGSRRPA